MEAQFTYREDSLTLSKIFHEIKNPLTLINSSLQLIESEHPEVKAFRFWNQTMEDMKNLRLLLDDISSFQKGSLLNITEIYMSDFADDLLDSMEAFLIEAGTPLTLEIPEIEDDFTFSADGTKLRQAVVNLLKNASESSENGSPVSLSMRRDDDFLILSVADCGCGIAPESLAHIFEPFHTTKSSGTGLGLPIVKQIVESHHGTIAVNSVKNSGTVFTLRIPLNPHETN